MYSHVTTLTFTVTYEKIELLKGHLLSFVASYHLFVFFNNANTYLHNEDICTILHRILAWTNNATDKCGQGPIQSFYSHSAPVQKPDRCAF